MSFKSPSFTILNNVQYIYQYCTSLSSLFCEKCKSVEMKCKIAYYYTRRPCDYIDGTDSSASESAGISGFRIHNSKLKKPARRRAFKIYLFVFCSNAKAAFELYACVCDSSSPAGLSCRAVFVLIALRSVCHLGNLEIGSPCAPDKHLTYHDVGGE